MHGLARVHHGLCSVGGHHGCQSLNVIFVVEDGAAHVGLSVLLVLEVHEIAQLAEEVRVLRQLVKDKMADSFDGVSTIKVSSFRIQQEVLFTVEEEVTSGRNVLVLAVLADLSDVKVLFQAPIPHANEVKVRGGEDEGVIHRVLLEVGHDAVGEVVEAMIDGTVRTVRVEAMEHHRYRSGHPGQGALKYRIH